MNAARIIFESFRDGGYARMQQADPEGLRLDYKTTVFEGKNLSEDAKGHFYKWGSGFANVEGGVLIWGINSKNGVWEEKPLSDCVRFAELLSALAPNALDPALPGIENIAIPKDEGPEGFVVTYFPESRHKPHQVAGKGGFYMRIADNVVLMPTGIVLAVSQAQHMPEVELRARMEYEPRSSYPVLAMLSIANIGRTTIIDPAIIVPITHGTSASTHDVGGYPGEYAFVSDWPDFDSVHNAKVFDLKATPRIFPGTEVKAIYYKIHEQHVKSYGEWFSLRFRVICEGLEVESTIQFPLQQQRDRSVVYRSLS